jgi:uncharacterized protein (TIGR03066 family)
MSLLCGLLIGLTSTVTGADTPKSNNEGKIVGIWEATGGLLPPGATFTMEFIKDGKIDMTIKNGPTTVNITGKYTLGEGNKVHFKELSKPISGKTEHIESISIKDDKLTMTDADGKSLTFNKKPEKKDE